MDRKKKLDNLIPYISQEDIFLTCINFDQAYKHFMIRIGKLSNKEKEVLINYFKGQFISTILQTMLPMKTI